MAVYMKLTPESKTVVSVAGDVALTKTVYQLEDASSQVAAMHRQMPGDYQIVRVSKIEASEVRNDSLIERLMAWVKRLLSH